ncbi:MAG: 23S rRNA (adenine(2503)-C(2))-methyltransferase RlmN [Acidobacteriota bacterium]
MSKIELLGLNEREIEDFAVSVGEQRFRGRQIYRWIYRKNVGSFYDMSDVPKELRQKLDENAEISLPRVIKARISKDGTRKFLLEMADRKLIEMVAIPQSWKGGKKYTVCLSTQVGCPLGCEFCATGQSGFERDLTVGEIVGQVIVAEREIRNREKLSDEERCVTNLVYMGMGEPLLNYDAVVDSVRLINDERGINIGQRHITISTAGIIPAIKRLAAEDLQITLAISLHASSNEVRTGIMPINKRYPIKEIVEAVEEYTRATGRRATFEYLLLDGINTGPEDARRLAGLIRPLLANVNLIPYNKVDESGFNRPNPYTVAQFLSILEAAGVNATLREEMGTDIDAACGQLRSRRSHKVASYNRLKQENQGG